MTLGEKITALRLERKLSQGELAERLKVSRQSVSKWETDASIPELDKLLALSDLFGVSLDQLVRQEIPPSGKTGRQEQPSTAAPSAAPALNGGKIVGYILLGVGLCVAALGMALSRVLLLLGGYLLFCSLICLLVRRHPGLVIAWVTLLTFLILSPYVVGNPVFAVFHPEAYAQGISISLLLGLLVWALLLALAAYTLWLLRRGREGKSGREKP